MKSSKACSGFGSQLTSGFKGMILVYKFLKSFDEYVSSCTSPKKLTEFSGYSKFSSTTHSSISFEQVLSGREGSLIRFKLMLSRVFAMKKRPEFQFLDRIQSVAEHSLDEVRDPTCMIPTTEPMTFQ